MKNCKVHICFWLCDKKLLEDARVVIEAMPKYILAARGQSGENLSCRVPQWNKTIFDNGKMGDVSICVRVQCWDSVHQSRETVPPYTTLCNIVPRET